LKNNKLNLLLYIQNYKNNITSNQIAEFVKIGLINNQRTTKIYKIIANILKYKIRNNTIKGYKILISGRPYKISRSRIFCLQKGCLKKNTINENVDYAYV
jgi:hypothetical protein